MTIQRVANVGWAQPLRNPPDHRPPPAAPAAPAVQALVERAGEAGTAFASVLNAGVLGRPLRPGDLIAVRVLSTAPRMELAVEAGPPPASRAPSDELPDAMKADQLTLRQLHWRAPGTLDMASTMRSQVFQRITTELALREGAIGYEPAPLMAGAERASGTVYTVLPPTIASERWIFPLHLAGGQLAHLQVGDATEEDGRPSARPHTQSAVLLLDLDLPLLGRVRIRLYIAAGAHLQFVLDSDAAIAHLRSIVPQLAAALALAGTRLASCRLLRAPATLPRARALDVNDASSLHGRLPLSLFRLAAEVLHALTTTPQHAG